MAYLGEEVEYETDGTDDAAEEEGQCDGGVENAASHAVEHPCRGEERETKRDGDEHDLLWQMQVKNKNEQSAKIQTHVNGWDDCFGTAAVRSSSSLRGPVGCCSRLGSSERK